MKIAHSSAELHDRRRGRQCLEDHRLRSSKAKARARRPRRFSPSRPSAEPPPSTCCARRPFSNSARTRLVEIASCCGGIAAIVGASDPHGGRHDQRRGADPASQGRCATSARNTSPRAAKWDFLVPSKGYEYATIKRPVSAPIIVGDDLSRELRLRPVGRNCHPRSTPANTAREP